MRDLSSELEWAKVGLLTPATYPAAAAAAGRGEVAGQEAAVVARLVEAYEDAKTARGVIDFEDVLLLTAAMLREREDVARQVRSRYRWFTVDEYQDVSAAQQVLLDAWVGGRDDVCVVGDPHQTIYTFAGADSSLLGGFAARHPGATVVHLVRSYRSRPPVVELGNAVLAPAPGAGGPAAARAVRPGAGRARPPGGAEAAPGPRAADLHRARGRRRRGRGVRRSASSTCVARGVRPADVAVLVRTNGQLEVLEQAFGDRGLPYLVRGADRFFSRREVREAVVLLRGAAKVARDAVPAASDRAGSGPGPAVRCRRRRRRCRAVRTRRRPRGAAQEPVHPLVRTVSDVLSGAGLVARAAGGARAGAGPVGVAGRARRPRPPARRPRTPRPTCRASSPTSSSAPPSSTRPCWTG